ncbi:MAG: hypothetical protein H0X38_10825 [Planctomycetes bacterium]|nr:hypothetical protein [Planctomycetota bacterium]
MPTTTISTARSAPHGARTCAGFTLFEVAISLALALVGVVSVAMLMPAGIKAEQLARLRIYAGVKAEEIVEEFANTSNTSPSIDTEAPDAWDVPTGYRVMAPDLEARVSAPRFGIMPLPDVIARRLASDDGEIEGILAQGGKLYYAQAQETSGLTDSVQAQNATVPTDNQTQRLVFAVTGYAQNNNLAHLAWKDWPYYEPYPSPPGHGEKEGYGYNWGGAIVAPDHEPADAVTFSYSGGSYAAAIHLWEGVGAGGPDAGSLDGHGGSIDADISKVFTIGYQPYGMGGAGANSAAGAQTYLQAALWYCARRNVPAAVYAPAQGFTLATQLALAMGQFTSASIVPEGQKWSWVQAMRFLAHASTCMTRWHDLAALGGQPSLVGGFAVPAATISGSPDSPAITLTHDLIVYWHELSLRMAMLYCASQPYDWGAPRPTQRALMNDYPLIECDLMAPLLSGTISGAGVAAQQWRPIAAHLIANPGRSYSYPDTPIDPAGTRFGTNPTDFTLAMPFAAAERCRQLVFWAADWQSYEDAETAPSAAIDASKYLFSAPMDTGGAPISFDQRMSHCLWPDHHIFQFRNPEKIVTFTDPAVPGLPTGADVANKRILSADGEGQDKYDGSAASSARFLGLYGADRNFNGRLDRGTIPASVRLRATLVSRYNFYDPRLTLKLR